MQCDARAPGRVLTVCRVEPRLRARALAVVDIHWQIDVTSVELSTTSVPANHVRHTTPATLLPDCETHHVALMRCVST